MIKKLLTTLGALGAIAAPMTLSTPAEATTNWGPLTPTNSVTKTDHGTGGNYVTVQGDVNVFGAASSVTANVGVFDNAAQATCTSGLKPTQVKSNATSWLDGNVAALCPLFDTAVSGLGAVDSH